MPWPVGPVQVGINGENSALHVWVDNTSEDPREVVVAAPAVPMGSFMEMLLGHRSGGVVKPAAAQAPGSRIGGVSTATAAATLTDTGQAWPANSQNNKGCFALGGVVAQQYNLVLSHTVTVLTMKSNWVTQPTSPATYQLLTPAEQGQGATVSYAAGPANALVDTGKAWIVNQWRGLWVAVAGELRLIVSNTATQLTLDRAWGTTPGAQQAYGILNALFMDWNMTQRGDSAGSDGVGNNLNPDTL
jgi:hypothetical protein